MRAAVVGLAGIVVAGCASESSRPPAAQSEFWAQREASYRGDPRGPFTAIHAGYLTRGDSLHLYAYDDSVSTVPGGLAAVKIRYDEHWGFTIRPIEDWEPPTLDGELVETGYQVGDGSGVQLGRYLFSFGEQAADLGRVLAYDPRRMSTFHGFPVFPETEDLRIDARITPADRDTVTLGTTRGLEKEYVRVAFLDFELGGAACRLSAFLPPEKKLDPWFVPFTDATSGDESYGVGRYLRVDHAEGEAVARVDFNRATNPWCAYSPFYNCVLPPEENRLRVAIRAGERAPAGHS